MLYYIDKPRTRTTTIDWLTGWYKNKVMGKKEEKISALVGSSSSSEERIRVGSWILLISKTNGKPNAHKLRFSKLVFDHSHHSLELSRTYLRQTEEEGKPAKDDEYLAHCVSDLGLACVALNALPLQRAQLTTVDLKEWQNDLMIFLENTSQTTHIRTVETALQVTVVEATAVQLLLRLLALFTGGGAPVRLCHLLLLLRIGRQQDAGDAELGDKGQKKDDHVLRKNN